MSKVGFPVEKFPPPTPSKRICVLSFCFVLHVCCFVYWVINVAWKLVEENVYAKPMDGPSNGHREDKDEKKPEEKEEDEAAGSAGK